MESRNKENHTHSESCGTTSGSTSSKVSASAVTAWRRRRSARFLRTLAATGRRRRTAVPSRGHVTGTTKCRSNVSAYPVYLICHR
ncbi:unnamed protein product [Acanthoscelides obtectus]|uniref:Uncharacterized protein n=1 Tax=Acanthoscelides obtectus TaxID=200917 RepID=A0A9P0LZT4_ACAOB|nr:unnamed protein product [Acanthoscelides obtectus]CAK1650372.1 hypothetical protein AOBTE_LOCUS16749 [Acanthoscelides obtectus]